MKDIDLLLKQQYWAEDYARVLSIKLLSYKYELKEVADILNVPIGTINGWKESFDTYGAKSLINKGNQLRAYLTPDEGATTLNWIRSQSRRDVKALKHYLLDNYNVAYKTDKSYHNLFKAAGVKAGNKSLPKPKVMEMKERYKEGEKAVILYKEYGISNSTFYRLINKET